MNLFYKLFSGLRLNSNKRNTFIELYGPSHFNYYVHSHCSRGILETIEDKGYTIDIGRTRQYHAEELISKYSDITHCDHCGIEFKYSDSPYTNYCALRPEQISI